MLIEVLRRAARAVHELSCLESMHGMSCPHEIGENSGEALEAYAAITEVAHLIEAQALRDAAREIRSEGPDELSYASAFARHLETRAAQKEKGKL